MVTYSIHTTHYTGQTRLLCIQAKLDAALTKGERSCEEQEEQEETAEEIQQGLSEDRRNGILGETCSIGVDEEK